MTRLGSTLALILAVLTLGGVERAARSELATGCCKVGRSEVVVALASPRSPMPLERRLVSPRSSERSGASSTSLPAARVRWQYRLVSNGFAVVLPSAQLPRLRDLPGVRDVFDSARYTPQLDRSPQQIGAPALWGQNLETAGQGMKIGVIDTGVDQAHPFRSQRLLDAGRLPEGPGALHQCEGHRRPRVPAAPRQEPERRPRLRRRQLWARDTRGRDRRGQCTHTCERPDGVGRRAARTSATTGPWSGRTRA